MASTPQPTRPPATATTAVVLTGTGIPHSSATRAGPGVLVRHGDLRLQFDAGRGTVMRLAEAGVRPPQLSALFVTHHHSDHLLDLADVVLTRWLEHGAGPLTVVAPAGSSARFVERLLDPWDDDLADRAAHTGWPGRPAADLRTFDATAEPTVVWERDDVVVRSVAVHHEPLVPSVAFRVDTPNGAVVISGDTRVCDEVEHLASGAGVLVHEAARTQLMAPLVKGTPFERIFDYHADSQALGGLAERAGVATLVLTHLIPEPRDEAEAQGFADDVRTGGYTGRVVVGTDLATVTLP